MKEKTTMVKKIEIISRTTVTPSSPTPAELRNFKLSLLDQIIPPMYGLIVFFYPAVEDSEKPLSEKSSSLRDSLSRTLTSFYPMAGRTNAAGEPYIECSDDGAFFVEATVNCKLSDFLQNPSGDSFLNNFLPTSDPITAELSQNCVSLIQLTGFDCGGTAVSVCLSHKIGDISSLLTFLRSWTNPNETLISSQPFFVSNSLLPAMDLSFLAREDIKSAKSVTKRLMFEASAIARLKEKVAGTEVLNQLPSRVEAVLALILKCAMSASKLVSGGFSPSILLQAVNIRPRMDPPLPENAVGNLIWFVPVAMEAESEGDLGDMVRKVKKLVSEFCDEKASKLRGDVAAVLGELGSWRSFTGMEIYSCSSWCKFPLYEIDFGWGKPTWVSSASLAYKNSIILVDTKEGNGIEAWVTLEEQNMSIFENNQELLESASFNPSALPCAK